MNKEFVKKIIKAERLKYEALKEILPEELKRKVDSFERQSLEFIKEIAVEIIREDSKGDTETTKKETKKINVNFS